MCSAHHLLDAEVLAEIDGQAWARRMQQLLRRANRAGWIVWEQGTALPRSLLERLERRFDQLVREAQTRYQALTALPSGRRGRKMRRPSHNLALRLRERRESVLRIPWDNRVHFTNDQAERYLRMINLGMKISGGCRSKHGARDFATLRSVLLTAPKQGLNRIEFLLQGPPALLARVESRPSH
ncbi:MAG: transposase [Acidobacteriia bacterium]|nr:transposase [Terriglobia bacterium]MYG01294.1 transposase [Terriglobia bacterium]MYK09233.1 transposase [Terriglobia bacterium]